MRGFTGRLPYVKLSAVNWSIRMLKKPVPDFFNKHSERISRSVPR